VKGRTALANSVETDIQCFEHAWRCSVGQRDEQSYNDLVKAVRQLKLNKREIYSVSLNIHICMKYGQECIKSHNFESAIKCLRMWSVEDSSFSEASPTFASLIPACKESEALLKELSEAFVSAFYCDSFADLFGEPTDGKVDLPASFARSLLQDYETTTSRIMKDGASRDIDLVKPGVASTLQNLAGHSLKFEPGGGETLPMLCTGCVALASGHQVSAIACKLASLCCCALLKVGCFPSIIPG
jgi:hypothetical protein